MPAHPTAVISPEAALAADVVIGPYCIIEGPVGIGARTRLLAHVVISGATEIGEDCCFHPFAAIGSPPQDLKYKGEPTRLIIGARNVFRESVTVNRGTAGGGGLTRIGDDNFFMALTHIAHDCLVGSHVIMGNAVTLAGHVLVEDHSVIGAYSGVHQFCRVGTHSFIGGYSVITRDTLPYIKTVGARNEARIYGINSLGLERKGFTRATLETLQRAYRLLFRSRLNMSEALAQLRGSDIRSSEVDLLVRFIESSERGFIR